MKNILLIITGSVAAYKSLDLIRRLRERDCKVTAILTKGGAQFITPLQISALTGEPTYGDLWSLKDEVEMGHIRLAREADAIIIAPATADFIARMAHGLADDLATTTLLANDAKPVFVAPAMNVQMWRNTATRRNLTQLRDDEIHLIEPESGELACGEQGDGRLASTDAIIKELNAVLKLGDVAASSDKPLAGKTALVTAGPTFEAIDPVRFLGNRSSGKQGYAIARALADAGANVTLVSGPTALDNPNDMHVIRVESAIEMRDATINALPADIAVCTAAVADWKPDMVQDQKMKKRGDAEPPRLDLTETPDILRTLADHDKRPKLLIGFAAETEALESAATAKREGKGCDWIVANDVGGGKVFGRDTTSALLITAGGLAERFDDVSKKALAQALTRHITLHFNSGKPQLVKQG